MCIYVLYLHTYHKHPPPADQKPRHGDVVSASPGDLMSAPFFRALSPVTLSLSLTHKFSMLSYVILYHNLCYTHQRALLSSAPSRL